MSQLMIAAELGCAASQITAALQGSKPLIYAKILERCGRDWLLAHARDPLPPRLSLAEYDAVQVTKARQLVQEAHGVIDQGQSSSWSTMYSDLVRSCHSYVMYHYFGLIRDVDLLIDEFENGQLAVDHVYSIADGYLNRIPYWLVASPINLAVLPESGNRSKGRRSDQDASQLTQRFDDFITQYPRYWLVVAQSLNKTGIPKPFSTAERALGQHWYRSGTSGSSFRETHKHRWNKNDMEFCATIHLGPGGFTIEPDDDEMPIEPLPT